MDEEKKKKTVWEPMKSVKGLNTELEHLIPISPLFYETIGFSLLAILLMVYMKNRRCRCLAR